MSNLLNSSSNNKDNDYNIENNDIDISKKLLKDEIKINKNIKKRESKILDYISLVKIIACFSVIILHSNGVFWIFNIKTYKQYWISANLIESLFYFSVPLFVLCIGATLLDFNEKYGLKVYFDRRVKKIIIPLICWNIIFYFYKVYIIREVAKEKITFVYVWNLYFQSKLNAIFGSIHGFLKMYMIIPLLAFVEKSKKIKIYSYCLVALFISQALMPYLINLFQSDLVWIYDIKVDLLLYIFAGYIIQNYKFSNLTKLKIYFFGIAGLLIHLCGTQILAVKYKKISYLHKGYLNAPCVIYSCASFLFIKENSYFIFKLINKKFINNVGTLTFGPFFLHMLFKNTFDLYFKPNVFSLKYRVFSSIVNLFICLIITYILKKMPLLNHLVP